VGEPATALWTLKDEDTTLHIFGTVHLLKKETTWRTPAFDAALAEASVIWTEADVTSPEAATVAAQAMIKDGAYVPGQGSLSTTLTPEQKAVVEQALANLGTPFAAIDGLKPWNAALQLASLDMMKQGYVPGAGVERVIEAEAKAAGKTFRHFETVSEQIGFFNGLSEADQIAMLVQGARAMVEEPDALDKLVAQWRAGDVAGVAEITSTPDALGNEAVYDVLLTQRNARWVPQIEAMLEEPGTQLIAVGALHLAGEDSVIKMLRDKGYTVEGP
jgi:hypothetical protein